MFGSPTKVWRRTTSPSAVGAVASSTGCRSRMIVIDVSALVVGVVCLLIIVLSVSTDLLKSPSSAPYFYDDAALDGLAVKKPLTMAIDGSSSANRSTAGFAGESGNGPKIGLLPPRRRGLKSSKGFTDMIRERISSNVNPRLHTLLDGAVGKNALLGAIKARAAREGAQQDRARRLNEETAGRDTGRGRINKTHLGGGVGQQHYQYSGIHHLTNAEHDLLDDDASYFVSLAQFRDVLCPQTVAELFKNARNPRRVFVGIIDQREIQPNYTHPVGYPVNIRTPIAFAGIGADYTCNPWYMMKTCALTEFCPTDNVRVRHSWPNASKGPTWGRYVGMLLYQGEKYFMMIDSHSRFVLHWDAHIVINLLMVPNTTKKAILSHYPGAFESSEQLLNQRHEDSAMMMCFAKYLDFGIIRMVSEAFVYVGYPTVQPFSAGGFVVGDAQFVHEVPFDPHLYYVFDGEEILYSVRLWTHGYDLFTPRNNILFHHYARHEAPRFWSYNSREADRQREQGQARVKYFMKSFKNHTRSRIVSDEWARAAGIDIEEDIYGLGKKRSLEDYYRFAGIDPVNWIIKYEFCHNVTVYGNTPYKYHPRGWEVNKEDSH